MLEIILGRANTGKSALILEKLRGPGAARKLLLVPEHASHRAELDLCQGAPPPKKADSRYCKAFSGLRGGSSMTRQAAPHRAASRTSRSFARSPCWKISRSLPDWPKSVTVTDLARRRKMARIASSWAVK